MNLFTLNQHNKQNTEIYFPIKYIKVIKQFAGPTREDMRIQCRLQSLSRANTI